jgi:phage protein D
MTLTIQQIEKARRNFYAPAFSIVAQGQNVVSDLYLEVSSVEVEDVLKGPDRFSFVIVNAFNISTREFVKVGQKTLPEFFAFGSPIGVSMGYGDRTGLDLMIEGIVTEISTSFPSSGLPQLTVSGYDNSYCLTKGTQSKNWENKRDSEVVRQIAQSYSLTAKVQDTNVVQPKIEMSQESPATFITRLAERNGFEWFITGKKELFFQPLSNDKRGVIELAWGRGLVSFSPEIKLSDQVSAVEVHGWNVQTKQPIVGKAKKGDEPGRDPTRLSGKPRTSGAEAVAKACGGDATVLRVREPVFSQEEADRRAKAILTRRAEGFVGGRGESIGIPELRANSNVSLQGLGDFFNMTFCLNQTTHTVNSSGYRTTFEIKDVDI